MKIGYFLSSEEWGPTELVELACKAKSAGFDGLWISDHFHPWNDEQGHSPFVWSVIGAIAQAAEGMNVTTAVTCPTMRMHPAIVAQAAATATLQLDGRFRLGLGSGEALNEHIYSDRWPSADERLEMLEELVTEQMLADAVPCGPDIERHLETIREFARAGFDELYIQQIGPEQDAFFETYREQVLPRVREELSAGLPA
jgi:hypothetical protein